MKLVTWQGVVKLCFALGVLTYCLSGVPKCYVVFSLMSVCLSVFHLFIYWKHIKCSVVCLYTVCSLPGFVSLCSAAVRWTVSLFWLCQLFVCSDRQTDRQTDRLSVFVLKLVQINVVIALLFDIVHCLVLM